MKYTEFITAINSNDQMPKEEYYANLIDFKDDILIEVAKHGQAQVAEQLNMTQPKLSAILNILKIL